METSKWRVWLAHSRVRPEWYGIGKIISKHQFAADGYDLEVEGDGADVQRLVQERKDLFAMCYPMEKKG